MRTRIAPTPSGHLHAGNAFNFLVIDTMVRRSNGYLLLRIDDADQERMRPAYVAGIFATLHWLGIHWHEGPQDEEDLRKNWSQTLRSRAAMELAMRLREAGYLFACHCSRARVEHCLCQHEGRSFDEPDATWRLKTTGDAQPLRQWPNDTTAHVLPMPGHPVVRQRNGQPSSHLYSLADDLHFGVDTVIRGEDLLASSAHQMHLARLLNIEAFPFIRFMHHPLRKDARGDKLSKSAGAQALDTLRAQGITPEALRAEAGAYVDSLAHARAR